jgi:hypothetical protein
VPRLAVGDRVQHLPTKHRDAVGTVVRILAQKDPQIVEVAMGERFPPLLIVLPASKLVKFRDAA